MLFPFPQEVMRVFSKKIYVFLLRCVSGYYNQKRNSSCKKEPSTRTKTAQSDVIFWKSVSKSAFIITHIYAKLAYIICINLYPYVEKHSALIHHYLRIACLKTLHAMPHNIHIIYKIRIY